MDIGYAQDAQYPASLMPKLDHRKQLCLTKLELQAKLTYPKPQLSFEANSDLPCMANVLNIKQSEKYGRFITTSSDIQIGEKLLVEEAYVSSVKGNLELCHICAKDGMNFFPCMNCAGVLYCSENCSNNNFHKVECEMKFGSEDDCPEESLSFILRSVLIGISTFTSINEMMRFVQNCLSTDPREICRSMTTPTSKYRTFFKLSSFVTGQHILDFRQKAYYIYHAIMQSNLGVEFDTVEKQRFLVHLIIHHGLILRTNAFGGLKNPPDEICGNSSTQQKAEGTFQHNMFFISSYFNHSCLPNVTKLSRDNLSVVVAIQKIKKGQQLFITYLDGELVKMTGKERNNKLENGYGFRCSCELCVSGLKSNVQYLEMDSDFQCVVKDIENFNVNLISDIKERCIRFLSKYENMIASEEAYFILNTLTAVLQKEIKC